MNNKTLLDEFAMAALPAILVKHDYQLVEAAQESYLYAEAMMEERAKRIPATEPDRQEERQPSFRARVLCQVEKMKGSRVTCTQVFQAMAGTDDRPSLWALQQIGGILRQLGFKRCRSGGKDYYQL